MMANLHHQPFPAGWRYPPTSPMWLLRLLAVLTVITVAGGVVAFLFTRNQAYLRLAWQVFRYALIVALLLFALMIIERVAVIPA